TRAQRLQLAMISFRQPPGEEMQENAVLGKSRRDLLGQKDAWPVGNPQHAVERVVVRDRDEGHPPATASLIDSFDGRERLAETRPTQRIIAAIPRVARMHVQVATRAHRIVSRSRLPRTLQRPVART